MSNPGDQERLRRLRDRQIAARDPQQHQRSMHGQIARRQRRSVQRLSIGRIWSEIPHIWKGAFYGLTVGAFAIAVVPKLWVSPWALPCAAGAALLLMIFGLLIGRAQDTRDSLKDLVK
jgi:hypothetical protein